MKIKKGTTRIVLIFNHIVIKLPVIEIIRSAKEFYYSRKYFFKSIKKNGFKRHYQKKLIRKRHSIKNEQEFIARRSKEIFLEVVPFKKYEIFGLRYLLFGGIMANWNEYLFYKETNNLFVMPTYFSFFGLINIQKRGQDINFWKYDDIWRYIYQNSKNENQPFCDSHSFAGKENFV